MSRLRARTWKQTLLKLGVFLLLGAIVNVAVAWGLSVFAPASSATQQLRSAVSNRSYGNNGTENWQVRRFTGFGRTWIAITRQRSDRPLTDPMWASLKRAQERAWGISAEDNVSTIVPPWTERQGDSRSTDDSWTTEARLISASGWPGISLWSERRAAGNGDSSQMNHHLRGGWDFGFKPWSAWQHRDLSLTPIWPGFAINSIFYAALLWVLWIAPGKIRRLVRIRRGCCPACGYKIAPGVGPRCSECGHPLS